MEDGKTGPDGLREGKVIIVTGPTSASIRTGVSSGGNGKPMLSLEEEISRLEGKLACLSLKDGDDKFGDEGRHSGGVAKSNNSSVPVRVPGLEFPMSVQNDLRTVFKNVGTLLNGDPSNVGTGTSSQDLFRIRNVLRKPLLPFLQQPLLPIRDNDADISSVLSYLKLLSEVCIPVPVPQSGPVEVLPNKDLFWRSVIEPIFKDILNFLNCHVFKRCIATLSRTTSTLSESSNGDTSTIANHHGTGYAFHQQLGLLQKGVRILLVYMKRATSNLTPNENSERKQELDITISEILLELCTLMKPSRDPEVKTDFDIGLDIRCNIGVGICYSTYYLRHSDKVYIERFFKHIFNLSLEDNSSLKSLATTEKEILSITSTDVNKIALAFGILNTWLEQEHDAALYLAIGKMVLDIQHGVKEAVNLGSSRVMEVWSDKLQRSIVPSSVLQHVVSLFPPLEFFCFMYMPGHIDAVKNCCRNIISSLAKIYHRLDEELFPVPDKTQEGQKWITSFLQTILEKLPHIKWIALACVAKNTNKALKALELDPGLPEDLLTTQRALKTAGSDIYVALMSYHFQSGGDLVGWEKTWIDPLFAIQLSMHSESNWDQKRIIISAILNSEKLQLKALQVMIQPLLISIVKRMNSGCPGSPSKKNISAEEPDENFAEASLLAAEAIKMAHELKISISSKQLNLNVTEPDGDSFRGLVPRSVLHDWLWSENYQIRLAGLSLIVETKKTTEEISEQDFNSLKIFLKYNLHSQNPAFRQQFMSYFKKFVRRLKDGEGSTRRKKNEESIQRYEGFLRWFWNFLTEEEGLFVGANFGRRCEALECLSELTQNFPDFKIFGVSDSGNLKYIRWLTDTYENNKIAAMHVLTAMPMKEFQDEQFCKNLFDEAMTLCKSVKPPDSITGRYVMTLLMHKCSKLSNATTTYAPFAILELLYSELEEICKKVKSTSLILVASESPMYGCLRCIRMILQNTKDYKLAENTSKYREYVSKLLKLCFTVDDILFPVLGSAAPEGFLPGLKDSAPEENKQVVRSLTAQMLLVCAWRSMKEVALLMADMCTWFQIEGETSKTSSLDYLLTFQQVSAIGDHLLFLLKNLMHRGVFEQVFVGFKQLASRLWKSSSPSLNHLPEKWLQEAIDQEHISSKSITRRSAGLPFIFQALLSAECDNEPFLHKWVQRLLIHDESPDMSPIRIHSMNVLRGLFRDASFSSAMMPFVPQGLKMAFRGLKSTDWTERNSGLMLYGAVMRRSFGAKLNLMNAPTFFRKFPQMYDFLLAELDICIQLMEIRQSERDNLQTTSDKPQLITCDFTFHLLLLLSSFTFCCRVEDTHFKLEAFIPRIRKCSESDDMEVRKLSARALVPFLVSPEDKRELMLKILSEMEARIEQLSQNQLHGELCQFLTISYHLPREDSQVCKDANAKISAAFLAFLSTASVPKSFRVPTVFETSMSILASLNSLQCLAKGLILSGGVNIIMKMYEKRFGHCLHRSVTPGLPVADSTIANATIRIMMDNMNSEEFLESIYNYFTDSSLCSRPYIEEFLELCQEDNRLHKVLFCESTANDENSLVIVEAIIENYLKRTSSEFRKYPATTSELNYLKLLEAVPPLVFADMDEETIKSLISRLFDLCDEGKLVECTSLQIRAAAFRILGNLVFTTGIPVSQEFETVLCDLAATWSCSTADDDMRVAVAESYPNLPFDNMKQFSGKLKESRKYTEVNQAKLWSSIFMLAQDDESYIREIINIKLTASTTGKPVCDRKSLEILTSLFFTHFLIHNPLEGLIVLLGLLQRNDCEFEVKADDETEDRLFDKSEMNMYFEHQILAKVIVSEISEGGTRHALKGKDLLTAKLSPDQIRLYYFLMNMQSVDNVVSDSSTSLSSLCSKTEHVDANTSDLSSNRKVGIVSAIIDNASCLDQNCVQDILHALSKYS